MTLEDGPWPLFHPLRSFLRARTRRMPFFRIRRPTVPRRKRRDARASRDCAKTVVSSGDGQPVQAVVPANLEGDRAQLAILARASTVRSAAEDELRWLYPGCDRGAVPPLGPLYKHPIFMDTTFAADTQFAFPAGTHRDAIAMRYEHFASTVHPTVGSFAIHPISWW